ncbi:MAG: hypothetical protein VX034_13335 [Planctomycetota bacterium]|nr:hypothetical protein [Pirellulaceae bacterium]MEC7979182.1 hypothetical protein [Planctomycetota bacterium]MEC8305702.1 hypothetical protein [Planctomycetota bacterium]
MKSEDAFVVATIFAIMLVGFLASGIEIYRLRSEVGKYELASPQRVKERPAID